VIRIVPGDAAQRYPAFFYAVHSLRHKVFVEKTRWSDLASDDGRERRRALGSIGGELIAGVVEWAIADGALRLVHEFEPIGLLRAVQSQFFARTPGPPDASSR
jgi:N-acyl-L-homoserine lactone synthetase